ncbi:hypothetical protein W97_06733 [Coniosporium apollinis CBS 100218]|uniref:DUF3824 domain-containing protein n=1 Tax=Coniosporium apollinis (strain CBS 100218) TaxID=1168221 RepID=R7Z0A4_CONA1|nr:uncharacterized protein W97_06733 [Coniosporium apollinis CBS 100218]EON67479.1 hypothetical protein W97_06733 [Coniosporium apollinis CBS 100218]
MSDYMYDDRPRRSHRTQPQYVEETYIRHAPGRAPQELVLRPRDDSIEDIPRNFPPPGAEQRRPRYRDDYGHPPQRARSVGRREYDDPYYNDYGAGGYARGGGRGPRSRYDDDDGYLSDRPRNRRRPSVGDALKEAAKAAGLGGVVGAVTGQRERSRSRHRRDDRYDDRRHDDRRYDDRRSRYSDSSRSRSRHRGGGGNDRWQQAAKAAAVAAAVEAFRSRKEPGSWTGEKGQRIATAALGAAGIDKLVGGGGDEHSTRNVIGSAIGGLAVNRVANGARDRDGSGSPGGRSRSRSRSRNPFSRSRSRGRSQSRGRGSDGGAGGAATAGALAAAGAVAAAGKALYNRVRSKSRRRSRSSSADSYVPSRGRRYKSNNKRSGRSDDGYEGTGAHPGAGMLASRENPEMRQMRQRDNARRGTSSSSESTTDMEQKRKRMRGKEFLTAGVATVATIHAAHGVYSSMVASENRRKLVAEGKLSAEEARKRKSKNALQDAAAVGIAALGIKSAFSEWKEMNEQRHEIQELEAKRRKKRKQRERRERQQRTGMGFQNQNQNQANPYGAPGYGGYGGPAYADANPYSAGNLPPPPMGAPPARY